jgi:beta-lactamase regulating signal transducer with metallopeptidase domain
MPTNLFAHGLSVGALVVATVSFLLTYLLHSTILLGGAWLVGRFVRLSEAARHALWQVALVGGVLTAALQIVMPREPLAGQIRLPVSRVEQTSKARMVVVAPPSEERTVTVIAPASRATSQPVEPVFFARSVSPSMVVGPWSRPLFLVWAIGAGLALLWLAIAYSRTTRALGERVDITDSTLADPLRALVRRAGVQRRVRLSWSARLVSPVALPGGEICLPRRALVTLEPAAVESMLAHELAHVVRRDPEWLVAAHVIGALFFFQPLNRLALRRLRETAEFLSDDWAIERTGAPVVLAKCLASVAEWLTAPAQLAPAISMVERQGSPLTRRVRRILYGAQRGVDPDGLRALVLGSVALLVLATAAPRVTVPATMTNQVAVWVGRFDPPIAAPFGARRGSALRARLIADDSIGTRIFVTRAPVVAQ